MSEYQTITTATDGAVTLITLNRPQALNALSSAVLEELIAAFAAYQADDTQRCAVLTGAGDKAKFGQPEIKLGVAPGMGGSQRLTRAIGKAKAMEMCLTGRMMDAAEAERSGLVARVVPHDTLPDEAMKTAGEIAAMPPMAAMVNKEMVNAAYELTLSEGIRFERRLFQILAATEDKAEGMQAFIEKREGQWKGR